MNRQTAACFAVAALLVCACSASSTATPGAGAAKPGGANILVAVEGNLSVKRQGWSAYAPALFGMALNASDLLRLDGPAQATIACADLTVVKAAGGVSNVPCKVSKPLLVYDGSIIIAPRPVIPLAIPIVISPRKTKLLDPHPVLRWSSVQDATAYTIGVRGSGLSWTTMVTAAATVTYPQSAPALQPGATYKLTVSTAARSSDEESAAGLGFTMLKPEEAQVVRDGETRIRSLRLSDAATRLLIASLYAGLGLTAEAIEQLESLFTSTKEPAVARLLGSLYLGQGLSRLAEDRYLQGLDLAQKANDIEGQAADSNALGMVYEALGNKDEAIRRAQQAIAWYQKLGDSRSVQDIQTRLASLQNP
jgi:hypothetical protein